MSETSGIIGPIEDPWEKWIMKKAIEQQRARLRKEGETELLKHREKLRSENDKKRDKRNEEVYSKWLFKKRRDLERRADESGRLQCAVRNETERKDKLKDAKSREKFREWTASKDEAERLAASENKRAEEDRHEIRRASRLRAAEAYELWLIEHPFILIPKPSFVNPQAWDGNTD